MRCTDLFNAVKIYPQKHVRVSAKTCTCFSENTYVFFSKVRQTRFFYVHLRVIQELLRNYLWQRRQQQRDVYKRQVRAFRAMYYYYLVDMFGRVPLIVSSSIPVKDVRQSDRKEVFDFVVKELQESLLLLSTAHSNSPGDYYGRITRPDVYKRQGIIRDIIYMMDILL